MLDALPVSNYFFKFKPQDIFYKTVQFLLSSISLLSLCTDYYLFVLAVALFEIELQKSILFPTFTF